jgi:hypothetical protein
MRGMPLSSVAPHAAKDCGLLGSFNKMRLTGGFEPLKLMDGYLEATTKKKTESLESIRAQAIKTEKEIRAILAGIERRLGAVEISKGGKKRKGTPAPPPSSLPKPKKAKGKSTEGKQQSTGASTPATGKAKGKKKAGAKGKAPQQSGGASGASIVEVAE